MAQRGARAGERARGGAEAARNAGRRARRRWADRPSKGAGSASSRQPRAALRRLLAPRGRVGRLRRPRFARNAAEAADCRSAAEALAAADAVGGSAGVRATRALRMSSVLTPLPSRCAGRCRCSSRRLAGPRVGELRVRRASARARRLHAPRETARGSAGGGAGVERGGERRGRVGLERRPSRRHRARASRRRPVRCSRAVAADGAAARAQDDSSRFCAASQAPRGRGRGTPAMRRRTPDAARCRCRAASPRAVARPRRRVMALPSSWRVERSRCAPRTRRARGRRAGTLAAAALAAVELARSRRGMGAIANVEAPPRRACSGRPNAIGGVGTPRGSTMRRGILRDADHVTREHVAAGSRSGACPRPQLGLERRRAPPISRSANRERRAPTSIAPRRPPRTQSALFCDTVRLAPATTRLCRARAPAAERAEVGRRRHREGAKPRGAERLGARRRSRARWRTRELAGAAGPSGARRRRGGERRRGAARDATFSFARRRCAARRRRGGGDARAGTRANKPAERRLATRRALARPRWS